MEHIVQKKISAVSGDPRLIARWAAICLAIASRDVQRTSGASFANHFYQTKYMIGSLIILMVLPARLKLATSN